MWFAILSILFYLLNLLLIVPFLFNMQINAQQGLKIPLFLTALLAVILHCVSLQPLLFDLASGQSFTLMEIGSLMSVMISILATFATLRLSTAWLLLPIVYSFAIINLVGATFIPSHLVQLLNQNATMMFHIGLSIFTYAVCFIAMLYAVQLVWIDRRLKLKKTDFSPAIPPLMTVERHFFRLFVAGEILLTATLISGSWHLAQALNLENLHKAAFSFVAWIVFGIAILGHQYFVWRGKKMIIYSISGMILLTIGYFGSRLID